MASEDIYGLLGLLGGLGGSYFMNQNNANKDAADALSSEEARQQQQAIDRTNFLSDRDYNEKQTQREFENALALIAAQNANQGLGQEIYGDIKNVTGATGNFLGDQLTEFDENLTGGAMGESFLRGTALKDFYNNYMDGGLDLLDKSKKAMADELTEFDKNLTGGAMGESFLRGTAMEDFSNNFLTGAEQVSDAGGAFKDMLGRDLSNMGSDALNLLGIDVGDSEFSNMKMDDGSGYNKSILKKRKDKQPTEDELSILQAIMSGDPLGGKAISGGSMLDEYGKTSPDPFQNKFEGPTLDSATAEMLGFNDMGELYNYMRENAPVTKGEFSNIGMPEGEYSIGLNQGGRVGLANGGNPYAGLKYGFVNNIFTPTGGTNIAPPVSGPGYGFQDFVTPPDETASGTPNVTNPNTYNPMYGGGPGDGAANYQSQMGTDVFGNEIGGPKNPFGFGPQAMYGTDIDGTPFEDGKYRSFTGEGPIDIDDDDYGARFFDFLSGVPNITTGYGIFDYFSADAREERKAEAEADKAAAEAAAAAAAAAAIEQEKYNLAQLENHPLGDGGLGTGPIGPAPSTLGLIGEEQRKAGGGGGYQGSSKKGDSKGFGNNRDFGGGGVD